MNEKGKGFLNRESGGSKTKERAPTHIVPRTCLPLTWSSALGRSITFLHPCSENADSLALMEWILALVHMLVHRSTESLVIQRLDIPATESPSNGTHSLFLDEDYWELEHDELSPVKTRLRGRWEPWYYDFYNYLKDGFISYQSTRGQRGARNWRFVILGDVLYKRSVLQSRGTRPSLLNLLN